MLGYLLTAVFYGLLLVPDYPPFGTSWFWKTMIPIMMVHSVIVFGLVWLDLYVPEINKLPRWLFSFAAGILFLEGYVAGRFIDALEPPPR